MCQATEIVRATVPLPWWEPSQYIREVATGNATVIEMFVALLKWALVRSRRSSWAAARSHCCGGDSRRLRRNCSTSVPVNSFV